MKKKIISMVASVAITGLVLTGCANGDTGSKGAAESSGDDVKSYLPIKGEPSTTVDKELAAKLPDDVKKKGALDVALDLPYPPMEFYNADGRIIGVDAELARMLGQKLDIKVNLNQQAFDAVIPSLQAGRHDIIMSGMNDTEERRKVLSFIEYVHAGFIILVKAGNPEGIKNLEDLCDVKVSLQQATQQGNILRELCGPEVEQNLTELPDDPSAQEALRSGRVQAYIADAGVAAWAAEQTDGGKAFDVITDPKNPAGYDPLYIGIGVLKERKELIEVLREALQELIDEGVYQEAMKRYGMGNFVVSKAEVNAER